MTSGRLRFALGELATLPRAAVVVELQVRYPTIPIVFCETRKLAEEWTYRYLAAAHTWAESETAALHRIGLPAQTPAEPVTEQDATAAPSTAESRAWARQRDHCPRPRTAPPRDPPSLARRPHTLTSADPGIPRAGR